MTKKYNYLYKITNNITGKIYIGVHATDNLDDGYMGSGRLIVHAIEKHGIENFTKTILQTFDSIDEMYKAESVVVNEEFVKDRNTYNMRPGGIGGSIAGCRHSDATKAKIRAAMANFNSTKTKEDILRISQAHSGCNSANYGKHYISNNILRLTKMVPKTDEIPEGWVVGRNAWNAIDVKRLIADRIDKQVKKQDSYRTEAIRLYSIYIKHGFSSIWKFTRSEFYDSQLPYSILIRIFRMYIKK